LINYELSYGKYEKLNQFVPMSKYTAGISVLIEYLFTYIKGLSKLCYR